MGKRGAKHCYKKGREIVPRLPKFLVLETLENHPIMSNAKERQLSEIFSLPKNFASIVRNYNSITKRIEVYEGLKGVLRGSSVRVM